MPDLATLRANLAWSQAQMADFLDCSQPTIFRIEDGQEMPGPIGRIVARLDRLVAAGLVRRGMSVDQALAIWIAGDGGGWGAGECDVTFDAGEVAKLGMSDVI